MDACYVPNNPAHFGLEAWPGASTEPPHSLQPPPPAPATLPPPSGATAAAVSAAQAAAAAAAAAVAGVGPGDFALPPLELDPLPSLFPFSPCSGSYKDFSTGLKETKPVHDMADVLLSLKHAVVHPGQMGLGMGMPHTGNGPLSPGTAAFAAAAAATSPYAALQQPSQLPSASLSYTVHPHQHHQMLSPSGGGYGTQYCTGADAGYPPPPQPPPPQPPPQHAPPMFPSMSVNVSMNMTMGYNVNMPEHQMPCSQMHQWGPPSGSPGYHQQGQGLLSPQPYPGGATYSFTADFRPSEPNLASSFKPVLTKPSPPMFGRRRSGGSSNSSGFTVGKGPGTPVGLSNDQIPPGGGNGLGVGGVGGTDINNHRANLCRICGKTYARPSTLKTHLRTHSGEKPYRCGECHKSFSQAANLTAHVRTHSGEKPFRCPICDRRFSQSSSVTTHMRTHSGERPYRCRCCKKAFSDSSTLTKHLRIHSGEKPYQCKLCLLRFSQSGNLNRHMRVHGNAAAAAAGT